MVKIIFSFVAGLLTTLSPCVLPVLPFVTASSLNKNRFGPVALALGLLTSFVGVTLILSLSGSVLGLGVETIKNISAVFLFLSGLLFVSVRLSDWFTAKLSFLSNINTPGKAPLPGGPLVAEFIGGLFLGVVWTPCSGPSLGAALGLAGQEGQAGHAALLLAGFGLGAVIPLLAFAYGARRLMDQAKKKSGLINAVKKIFGILIMAFSILMLTGYDKMLEAALTGMLPDGWLSFITKF